MPLKDYAILKGTPVDFLRAKADNPHFSIEVVDDETNYRIAINARSMVAPVDLMVVIDPDFKHPVTDKLQQLEVGRHVLSKDPAKRRDSGVALDFVRMNLFDRTKLRPVPMTTAGTMNDMNELLEALVENARGDERSLVYAFGEPFGPENKPDKIFGFKPGNGIHDIHMNQGNLAHGHEGEDGIYQDGGLIFHYPGENRFAAYFTTFQSQSLHTDDKTGHAIDHENHLLPPSPQPGPPPAAPAPLPATVRIVAAMVNPIGEDAGNEFVVLVNTTAQEIDLTGWKLIDKVDREFVLSGKIKRVEPLTVKIPPSSQFQLGNNGGTITLVNKLGLHVHGVAYTKAQAQKAGQTITF
jgi:uncharacterized protein YukJ